MPPGIDRAAIVALALTPGIGLKTIGRLLTTFGTLEAILAAAPAALRSVHGIGPKLAAAVHAIDSERLGYIAAKVAEWQAAGIAIVPYTDAAFPTPLAELNDGPLVLFIRGTWRDSDSQAVAIVGTRQPTTESLALAAHLAESFVGRGWTEISGLARGIDSAAHQGALNAPGRTLAVLGSGITPDAIYPPENRAVAEQIAACGGLVCECHPQAGPSARALTIRNRLITGLSRAVIVIEAGSTSGALHAARRAQAQGRLLFAVPNGSEGNVQLLAEGALPIHTIADVLAALPLG